MFGTILCVAVATLGVDTGWEPNGDGGLEYIVQLDPVQLESLKNGIPYRSDLPKDLRGVQTIRFQFGTKKPPRLPLPLGKSVSTGTPSFTNASKATPSPSDASIAAKPPKELDNGPANKMHKAKPAIFQDPVDTNSPSTAKTPIDESAKQTDPPKSLSLLYGVIALTVGLAAAFLYLSWVHIGMRSRYRMLLAEHLAITQPT